MSTYQKHLYAVVYPNQSLVASQLEPKAFGASFSVGSARYYRGKLLFFEVDLDFRHPYFPIDEYLEKTVEHDDGTPKRTKFICSYRVLEHLSLDALKSLYAVNVAGRVLELSRAQTAEVAQGQAIRFYQELNPVRLLYASRLTPPEFAEEVTAEGYPKGAPTVFFTEYHVDVESFRTAWETNPYIPSPINGVHPHKLKQILDRLHDNAKITMRSVGLHELFGENSYRLIEPGFWIAAAGAVAFYPLPSERDEVSSQAANWWKTIA